MLAATPFGDTVLIVSTECFSDGTKGTRAGSAVPCGATASEPLHPAMAAPALPPHFFDDDLKKVMNCLASHPKGSFPGDAAQEVTLHCKASG